MPMKMPIQKSAVVAAVLCAFAFGGRVSAHVVFEAPRTYANPQFHGSLDLSPQKSMYIALGAASYAESLARARAMQSTIDGLLAQPTPSNLESARAAWRHARIAYSETEIFRFNDGPIDAPASASHAAGPEMRINAWPVDESTIDAVVGNRRSGLIQDTNTALTIEAILQRDQTSDESAVTTGWHAIEFLLWGQDLSVDGPGQRSAKDYVAGRGVNDRRREYLRLVTLQLLADLARVEREWHAAGDEGEATYHAQLQATAPVEVVGRALHGATSLVAIELFGERLSVALDSGSQEDEHSCFSDTSHVDLQHGVRGVRNLLRGEFAGRPIGQGLIDLVAFQNPALGTRLAKALAAAEAGVAGLKPPFDQLILRPADHPDRVQAEATVTALHELALAMKASSEALGIQIVVPGV